MNSEFKVALSHDIDRTRKTYQYFTKPLKAIKNGNLKALKNQLYSFFRRNNYWTFQRIIEIENEYAVKSSFYFLNESMKWDVFRPDSYKLALGRYNIDSPKIQELIRWLDRNGWEIGVHGSYNSFNSLELLKKEKLTLERIVGHEVIGIRQHYLNLDDSTWSLQYEAGFKYDSSLGFAGSKGFGDRIGFKDNKHLPFYPLNNEFLEIPLVLMDANFLQVENKWEELDRVISLCKKHDAILVINFHNHVFNTREFPGFEEAYIKIIQKCISENGKFFTLGEIYETYSKKV